MKRHFGLTAIHSSLLEVMLHPGVRESILNEGTLNFLLVVWHFLLYFILLLGHLNPYIGNMEGTESIQALNRQKACPILEESPAIPRPCVSIWVFGTLLKGTSEALWRFKPTPSSNHFPTLISHRLHVFVRNSKSWLTQKSLPILCLMNDVKPVITAVVRSCASLSRSL